MYELLAPINKIVVFFINVTGITLILTVFISRLKPVLKLIFISMAILMFVWVDLAFLARQVNEVEAGLVLIRIAWSITPMLFVLVYYFILQYFSISRRYRLLTIGLFIVGVLLFSITLFTDLVINDIGYNNGTLEIVYGKLVWFFFGSVAVLTAINFYLLIKAFRKNKLVASDNTRIEYLLVGLSIFFVANAIFNIIFPVFFSIFHLYEFGDYSLIVFLGIVAYATIRHNFFGIKVLAASFAVSFLGSYILLDLLLFSESLEQRLTKLVIFIFYIPFGYLLIRSVLVEVKQKEKLAELNTELEEVGEQKDEFISMAAHELRAPITAIKGYMSMIIEGDAVEIPDTVTEYLEDAIVGSDRMIRLVNNMLNVARIEEGRMVFQAGTVNLMVVANSVANEFREEAQRKNLSINIVAPDNLMDRVFVDKDRIYEVVGNLVSNAVKYTDHGSISINVLNPNEATVRLEVIDTGTGISPEEQKKLFQKFERAESSIGKTIGTGLGLYISKLLVEKFGGKIDLVSIPGKGSNFWFDLPLNYQTTD